MLSGRRIGRIGENRSGLILGPRASRRVPGLNRSACLDILLRLLFVAFALSHAPGAVAQGSDAKQLPVTPPDDTDWSYYCDPAHKVNPTDQLKCIGGKTDSVRQISISGELRTAFGFMEIPSAQNWAYNRHTGYGNVGFYGG